MKNGFGAIDLLLGLLILSAVFMLGMSSLKGVNTNSDNKNFKSVKEEVDSQVNQIENMRKQIIDYNNSYE